MTRRWGQLFGAIMFGLLLIVPATNIYPYFVMQCLCYALFACAFNLLIGYAGLLSFGHAMFLGVASYVTAYSIRYAGFRPESGIIAGVAASAALGWVSGIIAIRRQGIYFAMITLALSQLVYFLCLRLPYTGGEDGIQNVPQGLMFGVLKLSNPTVLYYVVVVIFVFTFVAIERIIESPFGEVLRSIRENEQRAVSLGYRTDQFKLVVFMLSAALAGLAGSLKAIVTQSASLSDVYWTTSGEVVLMTLLGGLGTVFGPVVGAFLVTTMQHYLAGLGQWIMVAQGAVFIFCVLLFRKGIVGELLSLWRKKDLAGNNYAVEKPAP